MKNKRSTRLSGPNFGYTLSSPSDSAGVTAVTRNGIELSPYFMSHVKNAGGGRGIFLIEGTKQSYEPLKVEVICNGSIVATSELPLDVLPVESMYHRVDLRTTPSIIQNATWDSVQQFNNVIFLHGFKVDGDDARGWHSEMFKRLWQSGLTAQYHGVTWEGNIGFLDGRFNYHGNVVSAFETAPALKNYVATKVNGSKVVMAHSLGNMVVASAIADYGMSVDKFFMFNAAIPAEAFDPQQWDDAELGNPMVNHEWKGYANRTWCSKWHELFENYPNDDRYKLTWRNRFAAVPSGVIYNYYSSGDEVVSSLITIGENNMVVLHSFTGEEVANYSWQKQERFKGRFEFDPIAWIGATTTAGWGFHYTGSPYNPYYISIYANILTPEELCAYPVFCHTPNLMFSSNITFTARNELLAKAIPALSGAVGSTEISKAGNNNYNINNEKYRNAWPRPEEYKYERNWLHSDLKDIAYFYNFNLFKELVETGELK